MEVITTECAPYVFHSVVSENLLQQNNTDTLEITLEKLREAQKMDEFCSEMFNYLENGHTNFKNIRKIEEKAVDYMG